MNRITWIVFTSSPLVYLPFGDEINAEKERKQKKLKREYRADIAIA